MNKGHSRSRLSIWFHNDLPSSRPPQYKGIISTISLKLSNKLCIISTISLKIINKLCIISTILLKIINNLCMISTVSVKAIYNLCIVFTVSLKTINKSCIISIVSLELINKSCIISTISLKIKHALPDFFNNKNPKVCFSFGFSQHNGKLFTMPSKNSIKVIRIYSHPQGVN